MSAQVDGDWVTNGNGNWADAINWSSDPLVPGGAGATVGFTADITGNRNITTDVDRTLGTLIIGDTNSTNSYVLNGSGSPSLIFDNNGLDAQINLISTARNANIINPSVSIILNDNLLLTNDDNDTLIIRSAISGNANITVNGSGTGNVNLEGANTFTGLITVNSADSSLAINNSQALGDANNNVVLTNGSTLDLNSVFTLGPGHDIQIDGGVHINVSNGNGNTNSVNLAGQISGTGGLSVGSNSRAMLVLSNENTFTGGVVLDSNLVRIGDTRSLGADTNLTQDGGGLSFLGTGISNLSGYTFTFNNNLTQTLDVVEADHEFVWDKENDTFQNSAGGTTFVKTGAGTVRVTEMQTYRNVQQTGTATSMDGGTLLIDYGAGGGLRGYNDGAGVADDNTLRFAGGTLYLQGIGGVDDVVQNLGDVKLAVGGGTLVVDNQGGSGTTTANLGGLGNFSTVYAEFGSSLDIQTINAGTGSSVVTTTDANTNGLVGHGRVTYNGTDFATNTDPGGTNVIGAFTGYSALPASGASATTNYELNGSGSVTSTQRVNALKVTGSDGDALTISGGERLEIASSGLLYTGGAAATDNYSITGGTLASPDLVVHQNGTGTLTIDSVIDDYAADQAATTTSGSPVVTVASTADLIPGQQVNPTTGIPNNRFIRSVDSPTQFTMTGNANANATPTLTFSSDLTKTGDGELILTAANTYSGDTSINGGKLTISSDDNLGTNANASLNINNGTLRVTGTFETDRIINLGGSGGGFDIADGQTFTTQDFIQGNSAKLTLNNTDAAGTGILELSRDGRFSGGVHIERGILQLDHDNGIGQGGSNPLTFGDGDVATFRINGARDVTVAGLESGNSAAVVENGGGGAATLLVYNGYNNTYDGTLQDGASGSMALVKAGLGDLTLTGNNTYSGTTTVHDGVLLNNGTLANTQISVLDGGTLGGSGTFGSALTVESGGFLSPGNSPGVLEATADLTFNTDSTFVFELLADTTADRGVLFDGVDVTGAGVLAIGTGVTSEFSFNADGSAVDFTSAFWDSDQSWLVFSADNAPVLDSADIFDVFDISTDSNGEAFGVTGGALSWAQVGNDIYLNYSAIPEPASVSLLGLGALALAYRRRRR